MNKSAISVANEALEIVELSQYLAEVAEREFELSLCEKTPYVKDLLASLNAEFEKTEAKILSLESGKKKVITATASWKSHLPERGGEHESDMVKKKRLEWEKKYRAAERVSNLIDRDEIAIEDAKYYLEETVPVKQEPKPKEETRKWLKANKKNFSVVRVDEEFVRRPKRGALRV